ncbi:hypothetical protein VD0002_g7889 [Verticillium dahliae]|nr:hypothetical protein VD0002_g7889 [Verticillium dahliae]
MGDEPIPATGRSWRASIHGIISPLGLPVHGILFRFRINTGVA